MPRSSRMKAAADKAEKEPMDEGKAGKEEEAINMYKKVFKQSTKVLGENHEITFKAQVSLAKIFSVQLKWEESLPIFQNVHEKLKSDPHHTAIISVKSSIAHVLQLKTKFKVIGGSREAVEENRWRKR